MEYSSGAGRPGKRGVLALTLVLAASFAATVGIAFAGHYHNYSPTCGAGVNHGMVHGSYTTDGLYFSEVAGGTCGYDKLCAVGNYNSSSTNALRNTSTTGTNTYCTISVSGQAEAAGWARVYASSCGGGCGAAVVYVDTHYHGAH